MGPPKFPRRRTPGQEAADVKRIATAAALACPNCCRKLAMREGRTVTVEGHTSKRMTCRWCGHTEVKPCRSSG